MTVSITNPTTTPLVVSLYHERFCAAGGPCKCKTVTVSVPLQGNDGVVRSRPEGRRDPASLTIPARSTVGGLHDAILQVPQIQRARKARKIRVQLTPTEAAPAPPPAAPKASPAPAPEPAAASAPPSTSDVDNEAVAEEATPDEETRSSRRRQTRGRS